MVTSRDEALEMADKRIQEQAQPFIDKLEAGIKNEWLGSPGRITANCYDLDDRVIEVVKEMYEAAGWQIEIGSSSYSSRYRVFALS